MKILVIDNDININSLIKSILTTEPDYTVDFAFNGREGLDKIRQNRPNLVMVDFNMPEINGIDLCRIMEKDDSLKTIPVIIVSAMPINSKEFQEANGNFQNISVVKGLLEKPFDINSLLNKVKEAASF
jgi:two-component system chemotaxis response regulator CheY